MINHQTILSRRLMARGAWLIAAAMLTGLWTAAALTQQFGVGDGKLALAAHLNALVGGLWLIVVALTLDMLSYAEKIKRRLSFLIALSVWANWLITLVASFLKVNGLQYNQDPKNNLIAFLLQLFVVLPALIGSMIWALGFRQKI